MLGALICERAGVLNLGIEGIFTAGAMAGWMAVYARRAASGPASLVAALDRRGLRPRSTRVLTVPLGLSQHVTGIGMTLLATSLAYFTYRIALPERRDAAAHRAVPAARACPASPTCPSSARRSSSRRR